MAVAWRSSASNQSTTTSVVVTHGTVNDGDILIAHVYSFRTTAAAPGAHGASGWTSLGTRTTGTYYISSFWYKRASSEASTHTFTSTNATQMGASVSAYSGCVESGSPQDKLSNTAYITGNTTVRAATITPTVANGFYVWAGWYYLAGTISLSAPAGMNNRTSQMNTNNALRLADLLYTTTAASGSKDGTAGASATQKHAWMIALKPAVAPAVTTQAVSSIDYTTATGNGTVTADGGGTITERGVCWDTSTGPTTANSKATSSGTTGAYAPSMTGLASGTHYFVRAYAINSQGTSYGSEVTFDTLNYPPTVALNSPSDTATGQSITPTLTFTGTDTEGNTITYEVQISLNTL